MSKQDRQGVRTPTDVERKYNLGSLAKNNGAGSEALNQLTQAFSQFEHDVNARLAEIDEKLDNAYQVGDIHISVNNVNPSTVFGGTWENVSQGYLLVGLDREDVTAPAEIKFLDNCYIWKRTA